jgi:hypothetical protein
MGRPLFSEHVQAFDYPLHVESGTKNVDGTTPGTMVSLPSASLHDHSWNVRFGLAGAMARESAYYDSDGNGTHANDNPAFLRTSAAFPDARALVAVDRPVLYLGGRIEAVQQSAIEAAVRALVTSGSMHLEEELEHVGEESFHEALRLARSAGLQVEEAQALHHLGCAQLAANRPKAAQAVLEQAVVLARHCRLPRFEARALQQASVAAQLLGEIALGLKLRTEAEALHPDGSWRRELGLQITWYVSMYQDGGQNACHAAAAAVRAVYSDKPSGGCGTSITHEANRITNDDTVLAVDDDLSATDYLDGETESGGGGRLREELGAMWQAAKGKMMGGGGGGGSSNDSNSARAGDRAAVNEDGVRRYLFAGSEQAQLLADGTDKSKSRLRSGSEVYLGSSSRKRKAKMGGYRVGPLSSDKYGDDGSSGASSGGSGWDNTFVVSVAVATAVYRIGCDEHCTNAWLLSEVIRRHRAEEEIQERNFGISIDGYSEGGSDYNMMANALSLSIIGLRRESDGLELALDMHVHESLPGVLTMPLQHKAHTEHAYDPYAHCLEAMVAGDPSGPTAASELTTLAPPGRLREGAAFMRAQRPTETDNSSTSQLQRHVAGLGQIHGGRGSSAGANGASSASADDRRMEMQLTSGHYRGHQMVATAVAAAVRTKEAEHEQALLELRASEKRRAAQQMRKCVDAKEVELQEQYGREMRVRLQSLGEDHAAAMASSERQRRAVIEKQQEEHTKQVGLLEAKSYRQEEERRLMVAEHDEQRREHIADIQKLASTATENGSGAARAAEARARAEAEQERLVQESAQLHQQLQEQRQEQREITGKLRELEQWRQQHLSERQQQEHAQQQEQQRQEHEQQLREQQQTWQQQAARQREAELATQLDEVTSERGRVQEQLEVRQSEWKEAEQKLSIAQRQEVEMVMDRERQEGQMRLEDAVRKEQGASENRYGEALKEAWEDSRRDLEGALQARDAEHRQALKAEAARSEAAAASVLQLQEEQHTAEMQLQEDEYTA